MDPAVHVLVGPFHAYALDPSKFDASTAAGMNKAGAVRFLDYVASPAAQSAIQAYLDSNTTGDSPYLAAPRPNDLVGPVPASVPDSGRLRLTGLDSVPRLVATTKTNNQGASTFTTTPTTTTR